MISKTGSGLLKGIFENWISCLRYPSFMEAIATNQNPCSHNVLSKLYNKPFTLFCYVFPNNPSVSSPVTFTPVVFKRFGGQKCQVECTEGATKFCISLFLLKLLYNYSFFSSSLPAQQ